MDSKAVPPGPAALPPGVLAYLGDAVFELFVRRTLLAAGECATARSLHQHATALVRASTQAKMVHALAGELTPEEDAILKRGRNAHSGRVPQGAGAVEYRLATGFEALIGFLYLSGRAARLEDLLRSAMGRVMEAEKGCK